MATSPLTDALDVLLDRTVLPGYSRLGYVARRTWWPADPAPGALAGMVVAVTGANSGLGKATVLGLARLGAEVRMLCRNEDRGASARDKLLAELPTARLHVDRCDVSDLSALEGFAQRLMNDVPALHGLVHNAGVLPPRRTVTADGHELTLATHVLGPHALTDLLRPALRADGAARVVWVSSGGMYTQRLRIDDPEYVAGEFSGSKAYARTKRMQVALAERWAVELSAEGITVHSMHPGWADTPGVDSSLPGFRKVTGPILRTPAEGADTIVWLMAAPEPGATSGLFWHDRHPRTTAYIRSTRPSEAEVTALWRFCVGATGRPAGPGND
jgi:dehydrogenase/reductase SDR family member 12